MDTTTTETHAEHMTREDIDARLWTPVGWRPRCAGQVLEFCDRCSTMITRPYGMRDGDGHYITVGCDCAEELLHGCPDERARARNLRKLKADIAAHRREQRHAREDARIAEGVAWIDAHADELAALPHPQGFRALAGETLLDSVRWMIKHAGRSGRLKTIKAARKALED